MLILALAGGDGPPTDASEEASPARREWVELITVSGSGEKKSDEFVYPDGKARLRYRFRTGGWA